MWWTCGSNVMRILRRLSVTSGMERSWCVTWMKTASVFTFIAFVQLTESVVRSMPSSKNWSAQRCKSPQGKHSARTALKRPCDGQEAAATCPGDTLFCPNQRYGQTGRRPKSCRSTRHVKECKKPPCSSTLRICLSFARTRQLIILRFRPSSVALVLDPIK